MHGLPLIGVTLDAEPPGGYSKYDWYALRANYMSAIAGAGGLPVALPHLEALTAAYLDRLDGLVVTGGAFDVDPSLYQSGERHPSVSLKPGRTRAELGLLTEAVGRDLPVLGICGGEQLLAVMLGGTLIQHIPDAVPGALAHEQAVPHDQPCHEVRVVKGTLLHRITGREVMQVNSSHHQAVALPGPEAVVNAMAADGVVEGIEVAAYRFCLGVQWHPEFLTDPADAQILGAFVAAAGAR